MKTLSERSAEPFYLSIIFLGDENRRGIKMSNEEITRRLEAVERRLDKIDSVLTKIGRVIQIFQKKIKKIK